MTAEVAEVLFVCVHNAGRSQMAAGYLAHLAGDTITVLSAGSEPADKTNPDAVLVMAEEGIDIAAAVPRILTDGAVPKFVDEVAQVTFNGRRAHANGQSVLYITERCVLRLGDGGLELIEIAPGVDLERDVLARMGFRPEIAPDLREMDAAIFTDALLGLAERSPVARRAR